MDYARLSNEHLLESLLGVEEARQRYRGALRPLFGRDAPEKCRIALELVKRLMEEDFQYGATLTSPSAVRDYLRLMLKDREHEVFLVIFLDAQHRALAVEEAFRGTLTQTSVYPREIVKAALAINAAAVIFAHNHPSGLAQPSRADELLTRNLRDALSLVDVKVLDHFIVGGTAITSFAERGLL